MTRSLGQAWDGGRNNFDFLRLALAVLVIFAHCFPLGTGTESREPFMRLTHGQMTGGAIAVDLFFVMSGFLIAASAARSRGAGSFLRKRVARIYPAFLVCAVLTFVAVVPLSGAAIVGDSVFAKAANVVVQTLRLREFGYTHAFSSNPYPGAINGSVWSIQYEFWCYIGVLLLSVAGFLRRRAVVLTLFCAALIVSVLFLAQGWIFGGKFAGTLLGSPQIWARLLPLYLVGVVVYLYRAHIRLSGWLALLAVAALAAASWWRSGWAAVFPIAGTYLVFYLAFAPWLPVERFGRFGDFSYGTYLYAFPVQQLLMRAFGHAVSPALLFVCATPLTLLAAVASWCGVERRFLQPVRRKETIVHAIEQEHVTSA